METGSRVIHRFSNVWQKGVNENEAVFVFSRELVTKNLQHAQWHLQYPNTNEIWSRSWMHSKSTVIWRLTMMCLSGGEWLVVPNSLRPEAKTWCVTLIMRIPKLSVAFRVQASTGRTWAVISSSSLRRGMFANYMTRISLKRHWSQTKSQIDLGPKLELTFSVTGIVTTSSVWITIPRFGRLIFLKTHGKQQWSGS